MAIFRQGKRVGPFDLRLGLSRDKSLQNVDKDPRLRQYANTENQMGRFRAAMASANGYARAARFAVRVFPPVGLAKLVEEQQEAVYSEGSSESADKANDKANRAPTGKTMNDLTQSLGRQINIHCDTVSMPGHDLQTQQVQFGSAPVRDMVTSHGFEGMITASFYLSEDLKERHFFEQWQRLAVNVESHKANFYDDYIGSMEIYQLSNGLDSGLPFPTFIDKIFDVDRAEYGIRASEAVSYTHLTLPTNREV